MDTQQQPETGEEANDEAVAEEVELTPMQKCAVLFAAQHAVAGDRQIRTAGVSLRQQNALLASGVWTRHCPGVVGPSGAPDTWERRVKDATLAVPGAVACGRTAARIHRLDVFRRFPQVKIAVPPSGRKIEIPGVKYTRINQLTATDTETVNGIPVTTVALTLIHLAAEAIHLVDEWPVFDTTGRRLAELDLANVDLQVGVECQSWEWHGSPSAKRRDLTRKRRLRVLGWEIVDVWWSDLNRMAEVVADVQLAISIARARKSA